ncbi:MAG: leucine-rich repeat domain-containing protein [Treponema sp.]|jgi:hypothetical protein|nr:leucine-rich repeat domain-containing protein [Treponema sp.]
MKKLIFAAAAAALVLSPLAAQNTSDDYKGPPKGAISQSRLKFVKNGSELTITGLDAPGRGGASDTVLFIPRTLNGATVTAIADVAFPPTGKVLITEVILPRSLKTIGKSAFAKNAITKVFIPGSVTSIGDLAFADNKIASLTLESGVSTIGKQAFSGNLLRNVSIPATATSIEMDAFDKNPSLTISVDSANPSYVAEKGKLAPKPAPAPQPSKGGNDRGGNGRGPARIREIPVDQLKTTVKKEGKNSLITIDGWDEKGQYNALNIPAQIRRNDVVAIAANAFYQRKGRRGNDDDDLIALTLPEGLQTIGENAFRGNAIKEVNIPASVTDIGDNAFDDNPGIVITVDPKNTEYRVRDGKLEEKPDRKTKRRR